MIWLCFFFFFFLVKLKSYLFFNSYLEFNSFSIFMLMICPLVLFLIFQIFNFLFSQEEFMSSMLSFHVLVFFVFLCFILVSPFHFILCMEICVYPMIFVVFLTSKDFDKILSMFFMFLMNIIGSIPFMVFFSFMNLNIFLSFSFLELTTFFSSNFLIFFFFSLIMLCKLPMFLLHFWLTKAHVSASGTCSMILASLMLKMGTFGLYKFSNFFLKIFFFHLPIFFSLSIWGSFIVTFFMLRFFDMKYLIACSSIIHMALIFPLVCFNISVSILSSIFMMVGHGLVSFILFYLISIVYEVSQNRSYDLNKSLESGFKTLSLWIFIFLFLNLGIPPFLNFFSEIMTFITFLKFSYFNCFNLFLLMVIPIMFCMQMATKIMFGKKNNYFLDNLEVTISNFSVMYIYFLFVIPFVVF